MGAPLRRLAEGCSSFTIDLLPFPAPLSNVHLVLPNQLRVEPGSLLGGVVGWVLHALPDPTRRLVLADECL